MISIVAMLLAVGNQGWFPFVIPWDDASPSITDLSYLNNGEAGSHGRIVARDGHFVEQDTHRRVRFMAVNMVAAAAFPTHADADRTAAHLAKLGINLVRFHHLQNPWGVDSGESIWKKGRTYLELDPVQLDKLDYLFAALKKHGIYSNLNLQTTRSYLPEMGFPQSVLKIPFESDKRIDKIDRHMIDLQKQYARDLLDRVNPYTGNRYSSEPALAFVEINNENSIIGWAGENQADTFNAIPEPFRQEVIAAWNTWLKQRYGTDAALLQAWTAGATKPGPSVLTTPKTWIDENQSNGDVQFESPNPAETGSAKPGEATSLRVTVRSNPGPDWHVQTHIDGLDLKEGEVYTLSFRARCTTEGSITAAGALDGPDWHSIGLSQQLTVGPVWKKYAIPFTATDTKPNHDRIGFAVGNLRGTLEIEALTLTPGMDTGPILGGSLSQGTIPLPPGGIRTRTEDFYRFLTATETAYSTEMRTFIRKDLGIKANLIDTQVSWGGWSSLVREAGSDYADNHSYWQHPSFPGKPWDGNNWNIGNTPMVDAMAGRFDGLSTLARTRIAGKPFTISEYNHPAPSDYRVEMMPLLSSFAALQDWDGLYLFEYGVFGAGRSNDMFSSYFDVGADPVRAGFIPSAALIFRTLGLAPLTATNFATIAPADAVLTTINPWKDRHEDPWTQRLSVSATGTASVTAGSSTTDSIVKDDGGTVFRLQDPNALIVVGHVANRMIELNSPISGPKLTFKFGDFGRGFAAATMVPLRSGHYLLTLASRAENQDMTWNAQRTSVGTGWGHGPIQAEGVPCDLQIQGVKIAHIWSLDPTGARMKEVSATLSTSATQVHLGPEDRTIWYELAP